MSEQKKNNCKIAIELILARNRYSSSLRPFNEIALEFREVVDVGFLARSAMQSLGKSKGERP